MQAARDRTPDQHSYFYVVWPEEKSTEAQAALPSPQDKREQTSPGMESAASGSSSHEALAAGATREVIPSRRYTESPVQSPDVDYLRQQKASSPLALDLVQPKQPPVNFSPGISVHSQRSTGHQIITLPTSTIVSGSQGQLFLSEVSTSLASSNKDLQKESHYPDHRPGDGNHGLLLPHTQQQLMQIGNPQSAMRSQTDVDGSFRKIGFLAEQAVVNMQKILQTTSKFQPISVNTSKLHSSQPSSGGEADSARAQDSTYFGTPPVKRFCSWENMGQSRSPTVCMECEVKVAEIQILRKRIQSLQEQLTSSSGRTEHAFTTPLLSTPTLDSPRLQQSNIKTERSRLPITLPSIIPDVPFSVDQLTSSTLRGRKSVDSKQSPVPMHTSTMDTQTGVTSQGNELTELINGSGVYILTQSLLEARKDAKSGTQLARKLMDAFWDKDTLAKSTLTPRSKFQYQQLDPKTIKAIEAYCLSYDDTVHSKDIHATMTDKCCQARSRIRTLQPESQSENPKSSQSVSYTIHS